MNPSIPTDYLEAGAWLTSFVRSHAKREDSRIEVRLEADGPREGHSYGLRLGLEARTEPPPGAPPIEFEFREVADGRTRFAWCAALGDRIQTVARALLDSGRSAA
jgi:hypothetical protein